jgi:hypothetical protein
MMESGLQTFEDKPTGDIVIWARLDIDSENKLTAVSVLKIATIEKLRR